MSSLNARNDFSPFYSEVQLEKEKVSWDGRSTGRPWKHFSCKNWSIRKGKFGIFLRFYRQTQPYIRLGGKSWKIRKVKKDSYQQLIKTLIKFSFLPLNNFFFLKYFGNYNFSHFSILGHFLIIFLLFLFSLILSVNFNQQVFIYLS